MTNICRNQVLHTGVHLISADVIILLIGAVNGNNSSLPFTAPIAPGYKSTTISEDYASLIVWL